MSSLKPHHLLRSRFAFAIPVIALLAFAGVRFVSHVEASEQTSTTKPAAPVPHVTVAPVEEKLVTDYAEITGHVDATETVELRARVSGRIDAVHFHAGQIVHRSDVLFTVDPLPYRAAFELASAQVQQARAHADVASREAKRADELLAAAAVSHEEAEARRSRALEAQAALASAEAALTNARLDLEHTEVRAPIDGRISRALITPGNLVSGASGNGTLLATIVSLGDVYVYADVDEATLLKFNRLLRERRIKADDGRIPVEMQLADENGYPRRGYIESTDNRLNPDTGSLTVRMVFANADNSLLPGLFARVRVPVGAPAPSLLVSERAIGTDQSQKFVLAVDDHNTAVYRTVRLGGTVQDKRVVRTGLHPGDRVIVNGLQRVRPGMTVAPESELAAASTTAPATAASLARR